MADQRILELRRQGGELGRRLDFFQQVGGQMQFAVHQVHILLDEVLFDGIADQQAERQQHRGRCRCEQQGQAQGDGRAPSSRRTSMMATAPPPILPRRAGEVTVPPRLGAGNGGWGRAHPASSSST
jgi:hypothetical protein